MSKKIQEALNFEKFHQISRIRKKRDREPLDVESFLSLGATRTVNCRFSASRTRPGEPMTSSTLREQRWAGDTGIRGLTAVISEVVRMNPGHIQEIIAESELS